MFSLRKVFYAGLLFVLIFFVVTGWMGQVHAQPKYPTRAIDIIVAVPPGGSVDLTSRIVAAYINKKWGVPVNVINKPGGNLVPGCLEVYHAAPDGYTLLGDSPASTCLMQAAVRNLPFKIMDRTFIARIIITPMASFVHSSSPLKSMKDLEAEAKKDPGNFTWSSQGGGGGQDYIARQFFKTIGIDVSKTKPIMARGGAETVILAAGGHVKWGLATVASVLPAIRAGTVRLLGVTGKKRHPDLPDVPTTEETGYPAVNHVFWVGISGPPKLPSHIIDKWDKALQEIVKDPDSITKMKNVGTIPLYLNADETRETVRKETEEVEVLWGLK